MVLPYILSLIVAQNILILILHISVHLWVSDTLLEHLTLLGQRASFLVEVQNKNLGTHIRMFLQNTPKDWAHQVNMYAFAHNSQPLSTLKVSPRELFFQYKIIFKVSSSRFFTKPPYISTATNIRSCFENCILLDTSQC